MGPPPRTSLSMRITASWSESWSTEYKVVARATPAGPPLELFASNHIDAPACRITGSMWHAMSSRPAARLAPCSKLSRTLRAGVAGAARAASWTAPVRGALPAAGRDEGMVACGRTKGWTQERKGRKKVRGSRSFLLTSAAPYKGNRARGSPYSSTGSIWMERAVVSVRHDDPTKPCLDSRFPWDRACA